MPTTFRTHPDHAVVLFDDELTWPAATDLVDIVDLMTDGYFYRRVEIVIASSGGLTLAFDHYLAALQRWRAAGVWVTTRVVSRAQSAAALMLSISDERIAEPSARLFYHQARSFTSAPLTASATAELHDDLCRLESQHIDLLVDRAFAADPSLVADSDPCDRRVLELLGSRVHSGGARRPRLACGALKFLAHTVQRAVRTRDRALLCTVYRALFALELPISGRLARTLRLVDRVPAPPAVADFASRPPVASADPLSGRPGSFSESVSGDGWLQIPQWRALFPPDGDVTRELLGRHVLALGQTGSGKSASVVLPVVRAIVAAPPDRVSASLIIDPKHEIGPLLTQLAPERVQHLRPAQAGLCLMSGPRWSLDADLAAGNWLGAATKIVLRAVSCVPTSPARVLMDHQQDTLNGEFFAREGTEFLLTVLALVLMLTQRDAPPPEDWLAGDSAACLWVRALLDRANGGPDARGPNALALAAYALQGPLIEPPKAQPESVFDHNRFDDNPFDDSPVAQADWLFARIARGAQNVWGTGEGRDVIERVLSYWTPMVTVRPQFVGVLSSARAACSDFAEPHVAHTLYFGCEPGFGDVDGAACDFANAVSPDAGGRVLVFQPSRDGLDTLVTKALKALFFEAVFNNSDRASGRPDLPLLGYVCDEAHRFVTSDPVSFVDSCRSYGVFCVLACQSLASIEHALSHGGGSEVSDRTAASILSNNMGSKFFFRSTDGRTAAHVEDLSPYRPGLSPITQLRPLSTLAPGECYAALADGRFERRQLEPVLPRAVERAPALRLVSSPSDLQP